MSVKIEVWGEYGLFTRPEMKVERVTFDMITPSAARGILESVFWHPGLSWKIDKIYVLKKVNAIIIRTWAAVSSRQSLDYTNLKPYQRLMRMWRRTWGICCTIWITEI